MEQVTNIASSEPDAGVEQLKEDLRREHDMYLRALADFENYRRRVDRDRADMAAADKRSIIVPMLDVLDGFERALPYLSAEPSAVAEGIQAIYRRLLDVLDAQGVTPFKSEGEPFDPAVHEAISDVQGSEYPSGTVAEELQRGFRIDDKLLRPARVRVAR
jgi:molecular chaperone GrpE